MLSAHTPGSGSSEMCGCADRPGRSWSPPASPPLTSSQSSLLIYSIKSVSLPVSLSLGLASASPEQKQEGVRGVGRDAGGSGGSQAWGCWHMILFLILPLGLSPILTSIPRVPPSPPSFPLPLSAVPVSVSRTFAFSRGDSLAGSPGNGAWLWAGTSTCARLFPAPCARCTKPPPPCMPSSARREAPTAPCAGQPLTGWSMGGRWGRAALSLPQPPQ